VQSLGCTMEMQLLGHGDELSEQTCLDH
jgi:hypothetical protein